MLAALIVCVHLKHHLLILIVLDFSKICLKLSVSNDIFFNCYENTAHLEAMSLLLFETKKKSNRKSHSMAKTEMDFV